MAVTLLGIVTLVRPLQYSNASIPIVVTLLGMDTSPNMKFFLGLERDCHLSEIIRGANDQPVRCADGVQHLCQTVAANAVSLILFSLTPETGKPVLFLVLISSITFIPLTSHFSIRLVRFHSLLRLPLL